MMTSSELERLIKSARGDDVIAQTSFAVMYAMGWVEQDYEKAIYWYEKAYENEDADAYYNLASMSYMGDGFQRDDEYILDPKNRS